jgi:transposase
VDIPVHIGQDMYQDNEMSRNLNEQEINRRLTRLRNLERLHKQARERIEKLETENKCLKEEVGELKDVIASMLDKNEKLTLRVEELQIKVFGKKREKVDVTEVKEKRARTTTSYQRLLPGEEEITTREYHQIRHCACGEKLKNHRKKEYYVEDMEPQKKRVVHHTVELGYCNRCRRWRSTTTIPTSKVVLGERVQTYICYAVTILRLSHKQIQGHLSDSFGIHISDGEITKILHRKSTQHQEDYDNLLSKIQSQNVIHMDETGDRVRDGDGYRAYTWLIQVAGYSDVVFDMGRNRGIGVAQKLYGDSRAVGVTDDYGAYANLFLEHQLCWAHLHRKLRDLATSTILEEKKREHCQRVFAKEAKIYATVRTLADRDDLTDRQRVVWMNKIRVQLTELAQPHTYDPEKLATHKTTLLKNIEKYLTCIRIANVPPDNNQAERSLRPAVLKRKISFGHISQKGARSMSILMSIFHTIKNRATETHQTFFDAYAEFVA